MTTSASAAVSTAVRPAAVCPRCLGRLVRPGRPPRFLGDDGSRTVICADCCTDRTVRAVLGLAPVLRTEWPLPSLLSWPASVDLAVLDVADVHGRPARVELSDWSLHAASWGRDGVLQMTLHGAVHSVDRLPDGLVYLVAAALPGTSGTLCCPLVARASPLWDDHGRLRDLQITWLRQPLPGRGRVDHDPGCSCCAHGPHCYRCPPSRGRSTVCRDCRAEVRRAEIAADPLYGGGSAWGDGG